MEAIFDWYREKQVERTMKALEKNNIPSSFDPDGEAAKERILGMIAEGSTVGIGGSVTVNQLGLIEALKGRGATVFNPFDRNLTPQQADDARRKALVSDVFLTSTNAVTEEGELFNIDATGNRVGAMLFGPKRVIVVAGINKMVKNLEEAWLKVQETTAPVNARRLKRKTPCVETGQCEDCDSPERICNIEVTIRKKPRLTDLLVVFVGKPLGF